MYSFGNKSQEKLQGVHPTLVSILNEAIKMIDFTVIEGVRTLEIQGEYYRTGKSKTMNSKHIIQKDGYSHAVDIAPYPVNWEDTVRFAYLAGIIRGIAKNKGVEIRWGGDWDSDGDIHDQTFNDLPHFELKNA